MQMGFLHSGNDEMTLGMLAELRRALAPHELLSWADGQPAPSEELVLLLSSAGITKEHLQNQPKLAMIQTTTTGYETVDINAATALGIWVSYAPSDLTGNATSVAEFTVLLMLAASRQLGRVIEAEQRESIPSLGVCPALKGKRVCIVGLGSIGLQVVDRLRPFEVTLVATDEHPERAPAGVIAFPADKLSVALADADFVVVCARASDANKNLISASVIRSMKRGAVLVNIARGMLVDEVALLAALEEGHLFAAGLDVVKQEPLEATNPLLKLPQVLLTPHIAAMTDLMVHGTVAFITQVVTDFNTGIRPRSTLNCPEKPRKPLREH